MSQQRKIKDDEEVNKVVGVLTRDLNLAIRDPKNVLKPHRFDILDYKESNGTLTFSFGGWMNGIRKFKEIMEEKGYNAKIFLVQYALIVSWDLSQKEQTK